jgi:hypothetical protein
VALAQFEVDRLAAQQAASQAVAGGASTATVSHGSSSDAAGATGLGMAPPGVSTPGVPSGTTTATPTIAPAKPALPTQYVASVKLDPTRASLQMSAFVEEVMSHLQALPGVQIEMTLEVQVNAPGGIDEQTARIVLENSAALKVDKPGLY